MLTLQKPPKPKRNRQLSKFALSRFKILGESRFSKIRNELLNSKPTLEVARMIQHEWGEMTDITEGFLRIQLNRLRLQIVAGAFGQEEAQKIRAICVETSNLIPSPAKIVGKFSVETLGRMEELAGFQRGRVLTLMEIEKTLPNKYFSPLEKVFCEYKETLKDIQKMRFDLGADEFKGVVTGLRVQSASVNLPDGTSMNQSILEANAALDTIFTRRGIPKSSEA